jgi:hypothetical protein
MRSGLWAVVWLLVGIAIGSVATGILARRMAVSWDRDTTYADRLARVANSARALRDLDSDREAEARSRLERELVFSLQLADELEAQGAIIFFPLASGDLIDGLGAAEAYARSHSLDAAVGDRAHRLRGVLCARLGPGSKYRGLCD